MGGPTITLIIVVVVTNLFPFEFADNHVMNERMKLAIESLCPEVDICNQNASEPMIKPNGNLGSSVYISCCFGCSCHKNCQKERNCCFPDDMIKGDLNNETSLSTKRGILASENMSMDETAYIKECVFARSGTPTEEWSTRELAYRMVVSPPHGGCINTSMGPIVHKEYNIPATCDIEPLTPWGDLLPVYSNITNTIYKNSLCAECHGVYEYQAWTPMLLCDHYDENAERFISLIEQIDFVQSGNMSKYCYVSFQYKESSVLVENRCFVDTTATCSDGLPVPDETNLTSLEIKEACRSGLYAPVPSRNIIYRNAFCVLCNNGLESRLATCTPLIDGTGKSSDRNLLFLVDLSFLVNENKARKEGRTISQPKACLRFGAELDQGSCRAVSCPSGQLRKANGQCEVFVKEWKQTKFVVPVRLEYANRNERSILSMFNEGLVNRAIIAERFIKSNPWPAFFIIAGLYMEITADDTNHAVAVVLETTTNRFETILNIVRKSMEQRWNLVIGGNRIAFKQALLVIPLKQVDFLYAPAWKTSLGNLDKRVDISKLSTNWTKIFKVYLHFAVPYYITKVMMCNLVTLYEDEYKLLATKTFLLSNLTNRMLFTGEFETVEDEHGNINAHVCVQDTGFEFEKGTNYSFKRRATALSLVTVVFAITTFTA